MKVGQALIVPWLGALVPRTAIDSYTLVLAFATIGLLVITLRLAKSGRDTVRAFVEVERAGIAITLEDLQETAATTYDVKTGTAQQTGEKWLKLNIVANNIGRSTALVTQVSQSWHDRAELDRGSILVGPPKKCIIGPGKADTVGAAMQDMESFKTQRFLWLMLTYKSPLRESDRVVRACFEVFGPRSNVPYREHKHEDWDKLALQQRASWWRRLLPRSN